MASKRNKRSTTSMAIAQAMINEYQPKNAEEMQDAIKDIFGPMFEAMLQSEMDAHLGYESNDHGPKNTDNRRNGYTGKSVKSSYGEIPVEVPRGSFEPRVIPKRTRDVSGIEDKALSIYAKGMETLPIGEAEGKHYWMQTFDEPKARGVEDVLFISVNGVSGLEEGARSIFKDAVVQRSQPESR